MKKKFRDSAISSEDLDNAIANRIELAFKEHQSTLKGKGKGKWCVAKYGDPYSEFVLCI